MARKKKIEETKETEVVEQIKAEETAVAAEKETVPEKAPEAEESENEIPEEKSEEKTEEVVDAVAEEKTEDASEAVAEEASSSVKEVKEKKKFSIHCISFREMYNRIKDNLGLMLGTLFVSFVVVALLAVVVFFAAAKGPEKVMVPDVMGKKLETGLLEMQVKELYPKISLRYSDTPGDEGTILDQTPKAGAIVKGYSRVSLVVSRGVIADEVGNYVGIKLDEMRMNLQTLFAGSTRPLILVGDIEYKPDLSEAGTILEQDPPEGTSITDPVKVNLVVSRGPQYENTKPPYLTGKSINDVLQTITRSKIIFDFTAHVVAEGEIAGTVVTQKLFIKENDEETETTVMPEFVPNYAHIQLDIALPEENTDGNVMGIFEAKLDVYPYAIPMRLDAVPEEGDAYTIISFNHTGGNLTLPYNVPAGTTLVLYTGDNKVAGRVLVN